MQHQLTVSSRRASERAEPLCYGNKAKHSHGVASHIGSRIVPNYFEIGLTDHPGNTNQILHFGGGICLAAPTMQLDASHIWIVLLGMRGSEMFDRLFVWGYFGSLFRGGSSAACEVGITHFCTWLGTKPLHAFITTLSLRYI